MVELLSNISFKHPWILFFAIIPVLVLWYSIKKKSIAEFGLPTTSSIQVSKWNQWIVRIPEIIKMIGGILLILALARPQISLEEQSVKGEGIDIMLVMDLSGSMEAQDFKPNRMEVSKSVAKTFIDSRKNDRIGLTIFGKQAFTASPLTIDHDVVKNYIGNLRTGMLNDGTAIGMGLATALNRLKESESKSKIVILMTDGENNAGDIEPLTAADIAKEIGVKVYTIGMGSTTPTTLGNFFTIAPTQLDETLLKKIAAQTGGKYFRAVNAEGLKKIYYEIDQLEKSEIEVNVFKKYSEKFRFFLWWGLGLFLIGYFLTYILRPILSV